MPFGIVEAAPVQKSTETRSLGLIDHPFRRLARDPAFRRFNLLRRLAKNPPPRRDEILPVRPQVVRGQSRHSRWPRWRARRAEVSKIGWLLRRMTIKPQHANRIAHARLRRSVQHRHELLRRLPLLVEDGNARMPVAPGVPSIPEFRRDDVHPQFLPQPPHRAKIERPIRTHGIARGRGHCDIVQ